MPTTCITQNAQPEMFQSATEVSLSKDTRVQWRTHTEQLGQREWVMPQGSEVSTLIKSPKQEEPSQWRAAAFSGHLELLPAFTLSWAAPRQRWGWHWEGWHRGGPWLHMPHQGCRSASPSAPSSSSRDGGRWGEEKEDPAWFKRKKYGNYGIFPHHPHGNRRSETHFLYRAHWNCAKSCNTCRFCLNSRNVTVGQSLPQSSLKFIHPQTLLVIGVWPRHFYLSIIVPHSLPKRLIEGI